MSELLEIVRTIAASLVVVGFALTSLQIRAALRQSRANVLLRMFEDWNDPELHKSVGYVHQLRSEWKTRSTDTNVWSAFAKEWVEENAPTPGREVSCNWAKRRRASQFLSRMGYMLKSGYITSDDLFGTAPEARRLTAVLGPIEQAIVDRFSNEGWLVGPWDVPFNKLYLDYVNQQYDIWYDRIGAQLAVRMSDRADP